MLRMFIQSRFRQLLTIVCLFMGGVSLQAQEANVEDSLSIVRADTISLDSTLHHEQLPVVRLAVIDSIATHYQQQFASVAKRIKRKKASPNDLLNNPYYFYLFASPTLYNAPIHRKIGTLQPNTTSFDVAQRYQISNSSLVEKIDQTLAYIYTQKPELIVNNESEASQNDGLRNDVNVQVTPQVNLTEKSKKEATTQHHNANEEWDIDVRKPNFWKFKADLSMQFMQNYVSDNWYKGGENHNSWKAEATIEANYDNKQKIIFTNKLEMRLGFQSSQGDDKHKYRSNSDLLRLTNKFGLQATKHWYYTFTLQTWTQFYPGYKKNDERVYSDFMSPLESLASIGMDYKLSVKNFSLDASISPFAGKFKYVDRRSLTAAFGLKNGNHSDLEYGSNITVNYTWNICKNVSWKGRIYYFTDYKKAQMEWENTFNLKINKFLSTKLFLYPRFDDSVNRKDGDSYFQFNETLSIGFDYTF